MTPDAGQVLLNIESVNNGIDQINSSAQSVQNAIAEVNKHFNALPPERYSSPAADNLRTHYSMQTERLQTVYDNLTLFKKNLEESRDKIIEAAQARGIDVSSVVP